MHISNTLKEKVRALVNTEGIDWNELVPIPGDPLNVCRLDVYKKKKKDLGLDTLGIVTMNDAGYVIVSVPSAKS
jgi:hypothetical protein